MLATLTLERSSPNSSKDDNVSAGPPQFTVLKHNLRFLDRVPAMVTALAVSASNAFAFACARGQDDTDHAVHRTAVWAPHFLNNLACLEVGVFSVHTVCKRVKR